MSSFSEHVLQEKLSRLSASQDSIETLSSWIIHHIPHASISVTKWLQNVHQGDGDRRVLLLYLANDVLQNSRRKSVSVFHDLFKEPLKHAASLTATSSPKIQSSFLRIVNIWRERRVYENPFLNELHSLIEPVKQETTELKPDTEPSDFKLSLLEDSLTELQKFEGEMKVKSNALLRLTIDVSSTSSLAKLKDKSAGGKFQADFEDASQKMREYFECIGIEVGERKGLLEMLYHCKNYHMAKTKELNGLLKDYGNIKSHFEKVKQKLKDKVEQLEKAAHTATSDPSSKQDITVAGDMEIDSDNESQDESAGPSFHPPPPISLPPPPPPLLQPDLIMPSVPPNPFPSMPRFPTGGFPPYPIPLSPSQPLPPPRPLSGLPTPPFPPIPYSPSMPKPFTPRLPSIPSSLPPLPPTPFSPNIQDHPSPEEKGLVMDRLLVMARLNSELVARNKDHTPLMGNDVPPSSQRHLPTVTSSSSPVTSVPLPIMYSASTHAPNLGEDPIQSPPPSSTSQDVAPISSSIDDRLKNLVNQKTLPLSLFQDYSDSDSDEGGSNKPYSPTAVPALDQPGLKEEEDKESLPTPNMSPVTPEYVNFPTDNPIGETTMPGIRRVPPVSTTPINDPPSATPTNHSILRTLGSSSNIPSLQLNPVSQAGKQQRPSGIDQSVSLSQAVLNLSTSISHSNAVSNNNSAGSAAKALNPENIKITPTLTTLLDKIFPQLSQSLQSERKRKFDTPNNAPPQTDCDTKVPRLESSVPLAVTSDSPKGMVFTANNTPLCSVHTQPNEFPKASINNMSFRTFPEPGQYRPELNLRPSFSRGGDPMALPPSSFQLPHPNFRPPPNFQMGPPQRFPRPGVPPLRLPPLPPPPPHSGGGRPQRFYQNQTPPPSLRPRYY